jgi:outer membrane receptor for ferrienterochelin and colicins
VRAFAVAGLLVALKTAGAQEPVTLTIQATTGSESRAIAGASVVIDSSLAQDRRTDPAGRWSGPIVPGAHRVRVQAIGFQARDTVLTVDRALTVRLELREAIVPLGEVIVTAARREQKLADAVVETEVITSRELRRGPSDLASVLTQHVGIQPDGGVPAGTGVQLRGFGARRVLVLVDGQPLVGRVNGTLDLARIPVASIERIEIVKGPQSTLYGSDAIGGVINLISKPAPLSGANGGITTTTGSHGRAEIFADAGFRRGSFASTFDAGYQNVDLASGISSDASTYSRRGTGALKTRWDADSSRRLELSALTVVERQRYRTGQLFHFGDNVQTAMTLSAHNDGQLDRLGATLSASTFDHLSRASTGDVPASDSGARDRQRLVQGELTWSSARWTTLVDAGLAVRREWIDADRLAANTEAIVGVEPFAQATFEMGSFLVTPGARLSWSDRWGEFFAPRLAVLTRPRDDLAIRASVGRGFRAPDFKELYLSFVNDAAGYAVYGNPGLKPERSTSLSLGGEWTGATTFVRATGFNAQYRDFIETLAPDPNMVFTYGNVARGWTRGFEVEGGVLVRDWRLETAAEALWTKDESTGMSLLGRPPVTLRASVIGPVLPATHLTLKVAYVGKTPIDRDPDGTVTQYREAFPQVNARISRLIGSRFELNGEVTNILNRRLGADWPGFTGRTFSIGLRWRSEALD